jgi:hypothetical protein
VHAAGRDDDIVGVHAVSCGDGRAQCWVARRSSVAKRQAAKRIGVEKVYEPEVRSRALAQIVARRRSDQRDDIVFREAVHPVLHPLRRQGDGCRA